MAKSTKSAGQKAHEARNRAAKTEANKRRRAAAVAGRAALRANIQAMKQMACDNKAARIEAHEQRNAEAVMEAALRRNDAKRAAAVANDNAAVAKAA